MQLLFCADLGSSFLKAGAFDLGQLTLQVNQGVVMCAVWLWDQKGRVFDYGMLGRGKRVPLSIEK